MDFTLSKQTKQNKTKQQQQQQQQKKAFYHFWEITREELQKVLYFQGGRCKTNEKF